MNTELISKCDFAAIKFEIAGSDFYYITKNRYGDTGIISTLPDMTGLKSVYITNLQDMNEKERNSFIIQLTDTIC